MKDNRHTPPPTLVEQIAVHLLDFPLNKPCTDGSASDQLLNDVLTRLRLFYPGAYAEFVQLAPLVP